MRTARSDGAPRGEREGMWPGMPATSSNAAAPGREPADEVGACTAAEPRARVDRDEVFLEYTKSICPVCKAVVDAEVNVRDNKVFLRKRCREHGTFEALRLRRRRDVRRHRMRFNKPGTIPLQTQTEVQRRLPARLRAVPRPQAARLPRDHRGQHGLQPRLPGVLRRLRPPARRVLAHPRPGRGRARRLRRRRGRARGGHVLRRRAVDPPPDPRVLRAWPATRASALVVLNTNGIRLAHDRSFAAGPRRAGREGSTCSSTGSMRPPTSRSGAATCARPRRRRWTAAPTPASP